MRYAGSAAGKEEYPDWRLPEIAIAGRSNVGKSSLLNCLGGRRGLARVSATPGRTRRLHFFVCPSGEFALVDLPGYGFAKAAKSEREAWSRTVEEYLLERPNLRALVIVVDIRRDPSDDERLLEQLAERRRFGVVRVATKIDKLGRADRERMLRSLGDAGAWIPFSARTGEGRDHLLEALMDAALEGESTGPGRRVQ